MEQLPSWFPELPYLRTLVRDWLQNGVRNAVIANSSVAAYPNFPLPPGFPNCDDVISQAFYWKEETRSADHNYTVYWECQRQPGRPTRWLLTADGMLLGQVDLDSRYRGVPGNFGLGLDLVLNAMLISLKNNTSVRIASRQSGSLNPMIARNRPQQTEVVEMRFNNSNGRVVRELWRMTIG